MPCWFSCATWVDYLCREHVAQLRSHKIELEAHDTRVTIISFGTPALAQKWIEETQTTFQFLVDPQRDAYHAFGLESSLIRSWNLRTWFTYTKLMFQGRRWRGIQGDSSQLGGDFIVDQQGIIHMAYRSHDPADRPTLKVILQALDKNRREPKYRSSSLIEYDQYTNNLRAISIWERNTA